MIYYAIREIATGLYLKSNDNTGPTTASLDDAKHYKQAKPAIKAIKIMSHAHYYNEEKIKKNPNIVDTLVANSPLAPLYELVELELKVTLISAKSISTSVVKHTNNKWFLGEPV